uniref:Uncharacterized protein n=1 Tax=viral metagenome TaxID=1070528 RepID=A0A6C0J0F0_9ZZZZ
MIIIIVILLLLITYYYSIKDIIKFIYYIDILFEIDRSSENCSKITNDYNNSYNNIYKKDIILDILSVLKYKKDNQTTEEAASSKNPSVNTARIQIISDKTAEKTDEEKDAEKKAAQEKEEKDKAAASNKNNKENINSNNIARDLYYFLDEKGNIKNYYDSVSGTLLGLFVVITVILILFKSITNIYFPYFPVPYTKFDFDFTNFRKHLWDNGIIYTGIIIYILIYIIILDILSDKLKRYYESLDNNEYDSKIDKFKNDIEEIRRVIYSHIGLVLILVLIIMISYKKIYGDYFYYIAYGISIICIIILYMSYFAYNEFVI